jgi:hypothetical protein
MKSLRAANDFRKAAVSPRKHAIFGKIYRPSGMLREEFLEEITDLSLP